MTMIPIQNAARKGSSQIFSNQVPSKERERQAKTIKILHRRRNAE
jgi:hypothetical protein